MATYLQGVTDYIPQVQPWSPDYNFYNNVLGTKQAQYNAGWEKTNSLYNSILNAPLMRQQNIDVKDEFFKNIKNEIQKLASVDLSLPQNVSAASSLFKPFYENDNIVKDMSFTNKYHEEMEMAESYRKCMDDSCKDKYWAGGVRALQYKAQDFINASNDEALRMSNPHYVPYQNLMEKATAAAKEAGLSIKIDTKEGGYIVTTKNGPELQMPLMSFLNQRFGDDPSLQEFYNTKYYLLVKENPELANRLYTESLKSPEVSTEDLKKDVQSKMLTENFDNSAQVVTNARNNEESKFMNLVKKRGVVEKIITERGFLPDSDEANEFKELVNSEDAQDKVVKKLGTYADNAAKVKSSIKDNGLIGNEDQMISVIGHAMQLQDIYQASNILAYKDYERTMKADPFALNAQQHQNSMALARLNHELSLESKMVDFQISTLKESIKNGSANTLGNDFLFRDSNDLMDLFNYGEMQKGGSQQGASVAHNILNQFSTSAGDPYSEITQNQAATKAAIKNNKLKEIVEQSTGKDNRGLAREAIKAMYGGGTNTLLPNISLGKSDSDQLEKLNLLHGFNNKLPGDINSNDMDGLRRNFNAYRSTVQGQVLMLDNNMKQVSSKYNRKYLTTALRLASDETAKESEQAQLELQDLGTQIRNRFVKLKEVYGKDYLNNYDNYKRIANNEGMNFPKLSEDEFNLLKQLPTRTKNTKNSNSDFYNVFANKFSPEKIMELSGGTNRLYNFLNNSKGSWVSDPDSGKVVDKKSLNIIDENTYNAYKEAIKSGKATADMQSKVARYNRIQNADTFERHIGIGSNLASIQENNMSEQNAKERLVYNQQSEARKMAISNWNKSLEAAQDAIIKTAASGTNDQVKNVVAQSLIKKDGELYRLATDAELFNSISEKLGTEISGDTDTIGWLVPGKEFTKSINELINQNANPSEVSTKAKLHLLSVSEYATKEGAGMYLWGEKPDYELAAKEFINPIARYRFEEDQKKPINQRKYNTQKDAIVATLNEMPNSSWASSYLTDNKYNYLGIDSHLFNYKINKDLISKKAPTYIDPNSGRELDSKDTGSFTIKKSNKDFLTWLGKYEDALETKTVNGRWTVKGSKKYGGATPNSNTNNGLSFDLSKADVKNSYVNSIEDHKDAAAQAHMDFLKSMTNKKSPFGTYFQNAGMGSWSAPTPTLNNISPAHKDQNYQDAMYMINEALEKGNFGHGNNAYIVRQLFNDLSNDKFDKDKMPNFNIKVETMYDNFNNSRYTIEFTDDAWGKSKGYNKEEKSNGKTNITNKLPTRISWQTDHATDKIVSNSRPGSYDLLLGSLDSGDSWEDKSNQNKYGTIQFTRLDNDQIRTDFKVKLFNPQTGKFEFKTLNDAISDYHSTNWAAKHAELLDKLMEIKAKDDYNYFTYLRLFGETNTNVLNQ